MRRGRRLQLLDVLRETRKVEKALAKGREGFLDCDEAAELCVKLMERRGIKGTLVVGSVKGESHAWVESSGFILDPTADQFKLPKLQLISEACIYKARWKKEWRHK